MIPNMSNPTKPNSIRMGDELTPEEIEEIRNEKMQDEAMDAAEWEYNQE
jgi:hypothetical protein